MYLNDNSKQLNAFDCHAHLKKHTISCMNSMINTLCSQSLNLLVIIQSKISI